MIFIHYVIDFNRTNTTDFFTSFTTELVRRVDNEVVSNHRSKCLWSPVAQSTNVGVRATPKGLKSKWGPKEFLNNVFFEVKIRAALEPMVL